MSSVQSTTIALVPQEAAAAVFMRLDAQFGLPKTAGMVAETLEHLRLGDCFLFTAGDHGFILLNTIPLYAPFQRLNIPELQELAVHPDHRGKGLGKALVEACEAEAKSRGYNMIGLGVGLDASYGAAQRLYTKLGYLPDGSGLMYNAMPVAKDAVVSNDDDLALMMIKDL